MLVEDERVTRVQVHVGVHVRGQLDTDVMKCATVAQVTKHAGNKSNENMQSNLTTRKAVAAFYVRTHNHTRTQKISHKRTHARTHKHTHTHTHTHARTNTNTHTHTHTHTLSLSLSLSPKPRVLTYTNARKHGHMHTLIRTYLRIYAHTCAHSHIVYCFVLMTIGQAVDLYF